MERECKLSLYMIQLEGETVPNANDLDVGDLLLELVALEGAGKLLHLSGQDERRANKMLRKRENDDLSLRPKPQNEARRQPAKGRVNGQVPLTWARGQLRGPKARNSQNEDKSSKRMI